MAETGSKPEGAAPAKGKDWSNLSTRIGSAIVIAAVSLACLYMGGWVWVAFLLLLAGRAAYEFGRMSHKGRKDADVQTWVLTFVAVAALLFWTLFPPEMGRTMILTLLVVAAVTALVGFLRDRMSGGWSSLGLIYVLVPVISAIWLRGSEPGFHASGFQRIFFVVLTVIAADAGAYFAGKTIGGPKLAPRISPNKTWAGLIGGLVAGGVIGSLYASSVGASLTAALPIALLVVLASVAGDFLESSFKRHFGVKDSGSIFPGHGGVLDRIDSHMAALSLYALLALLAPQILPL